jgi:hypothetical protein
MDETQNPGFNDAWLSARIGNAIDVLTDRALNRPQLGSDPSQAYGVDANGQLYQLGQVNGQIRAQVSTSGGGLVISPTMILLAIVGFVLLGSK